MNNRTTIECLTLTSMLTKQLEPTSAESYMAAWHYAKFLLILKLGVS